MERAKFLKKSILVATIGILVLGFIPIANAGEPPFMQREDKENNIIKFAFGGYWNFSTSDDLYFRIGWASTLGEIENDWAPKNPWKYKLFIDDEQINLTRYDVKPNNTEWIKQSMWYHIFGPGYFTAGEDYLLRWEFWVKRPYQGDDNNYWRVFVDYNNVTLGMGFNLTARFEYNLTITA